MDPLPGLGWCRQMSWAFAILIVISLAVASAQAPPEPQHILSQMDQAAANFRTAQAAFVWDQYQKVVDEHDVQKGTVYFRRTGNEIQMAADIREPALKYVVFSEGKVQFYQPS